jgi:predicted dehydrogenase
MIKIGVVGAGHLGSIHLQQLKEVVGCEISGVFDLDNEKKQIAAEKFNIPQFDSLLELIQNSDAVDIVTPTLSHFDVAQLAIKNRKHIFIEKPITAKVEEAKELIELVEEAKVIAQVGHVERFNPAFKAVEDKITQPMFIETHRLAEFNPRGTDVSVVLDLMIHDIDIVLHTVKSNIRRVSASGVALVSDTPDIANLTASRISLKKMRKTRFFQKNAYISVDFLEKEVEVVQLKDIEGTPGPFTPVIQTAEGKKDKEILFSKPEILNTNAIRDELQEFIKSIQHNTKPIVTVQDGYNSLRVANIILNKIENSMKLIE